MEQYIYKRKSDGIYIINRKRTWEKLLLAARAIVTIENPADVSVTSSRNTGQQADLNSLSADKSTGGVFPTELCVYVHTHKTCCSCFFHFLCTLRIVNIFLNQREHEKGLISGDCLFYEYAYVHTTPS
ncbi:unnamed protein product [Nyctereutes procyonoides]|uniref:(raccoon dog) hypothetical protein n=1 Tax=Nyctereutes procyonoides TaxID=34880 RepID=A0A811YGL9_NYCPR|nr:unnamed protein product [Nyctereutes procyonoides]